MASKKPSLGRGLTALLSSVPTQPTAQINETVHPNGELKYLPVDLIQRNPEQPRKNFDADQLQELADSMQLKGIIQPIVVQKIKNNRYEIIAGERRWRAAQIAKLDQIPAIVRELSPIEITVLSLVENIQRQDLNAIEEALAVQKLILEFKLTHDEAANMIGKSRSAVSNLLRLMQLCESVQQLLLTGEIEMGHARALISLDPMKQKELAHLIVKKKLSVRAVEALVQSKANATQKKNKKLDPNILKLQEELSLRFNAPVSIQQKNLQAGKLVIHYHSLDELQGILDTIS